MLSRIGSVLLRQTLALATFLGLLTASTTAFAQSSTPFKNLDEIARGLRIDAYRAIPIPARKVKIAVLDNGFRGHQAEIGKSLPASTQYHPGPITVKPEEEEAHGLFMAQLVAGLLGRVAGGAFPYELHLFSAFGHSNLKQAIDSVIAGGFDVVLYAQVWEYGGNGDGRGFVNALVSRATAAGVLWINAAGNFGDATYRTRIERTEDDWARLPGPNQSVRVRCQPNPKKKCQLRAVLSWNDFKDDATLGTEKDLDFVLTDDTLTNIRTSGLQQKISFPAGTPGYSLYPREIVEAEVAPGLYFLRAKIRSSNFTTADELRITTSGDSIQQLDVTASNETLLGPADNPGVITIGASDTPKSAASRRAGKPELVFPSLVTLKNGENYKGSSNSSAIAAAAVAVVRAIRPGITRDGVLKLLSSGSGGVGGGTGEPGGPEGEPGNGLPLSLLRFQPTGPGCFVTARLPYIPQAAMPLLQRGAVSVLTDAGTKIFVSYDPFSLIPGLRRVHADDMLIVGAQGFAFLPRVYQWQLGQAAFEVVQMPQGQFFCGFGSGAGGTSGPGAQLRLPDPNRL